MSYSKKIRPHTGIHFKWLFILFSIVLLTASVLGYNLAASQSKKQLAQKCHALAATVAVIIAEDSDGYEGFLAELDTDSIYYQDIKQLMMKIKNVNVDHVAYVYTVWQADGNNVMYVLGGESPESKVYTAPGTRLELSDSLQTAFEDQRAVFGDSFIDTPYGARLCSYAPIFHSETGKFMGLVGADVIQPQYRLMMRTFLVPIVIGLVIVIIVSAIAIWWLSGNVTFLLNKERYEAQVARNMVSTGRGYYQKMDELYNKLRVLRHDYKYHLNATRTMLQVGDAQGANRYLTSVEQRLSDYELPNFCANHVINAFVTDYVERCEKLKIQLDVSLAVPEDTSISDYDLCIILGNLLENAVNATMKLPQKRFIKLETQHTHNQILFMIKNSYDGEIVHKDGIPVSKKASRGLGLRSVKEVIATYGGDILFEWRDNCFTVYVALKLVE